MQRALVWAAAGLAVVACASPVNPGSFNGGGSSTVADAAETPGDAATSGGTADAGTVDDTGVPGAVCGNGPCESGETAQNCPADCGPKSVCGNGNCEAGETNFSCPGDCGPKSVCGNGTCEAGESKTSCPADCGPQTTCGNGACESGETAANCPQDCQSKPTTVCGNGDCEAGESLATCVFDCDPATAPSTLCGWMNCPSEAQACFVDAGCVAALQASYDCLKACGGSSDACLQQCAGQVLGNSKATKYVTCGFQQGCQ